MSAKIQVLSIRKIDGKSTVKAFVDLQLGGVKIMGCKIVQQPDRRAWLAMPSVKSDRGWNNVVEITSKDLKARITEEVLRCWATHQPPQDRPPAHDQRAAAWTELPPLETTPIPPDGDDLPF